MEFRISYKQENVEEGVALSQLLSQYDDIMKLKTPWFQECLLFYFVGYKTLMFLLLSLRFDSPQSIKIVTWIASQSVFIPLAMKAAKSFLSSVPPMLFRYFDLSK